MRLTFKMIQAVSGINEGCWEQVIRIMLSWSFAPDNLADVQWNIKGLEHDSLLNIKEKKFSYS